MSGNFLSFSESILQFFPNYLYSGEILVHPDPELGKTQGKEIFFGFFYFLEGFDSYWLPIRNTCGKAGCRRPVGC